MKRLFSLLMIPVVAIALSLTVPTTGSAQEKKEEKKGEKKKGKKKKGEEKK